MRKIAFSALALIALAWSSTAASACGGWAGCDYGYAGYGVYGYAGYGYSYYAAPVYSYYAPPVVAYYAPPVYYAPQAYYAPRAYGYYVPRPSYRAYAPRPYAYRSYGYRSGWVGTRQYGWAGVRRGHIGRRW